MNCWGVESLEKGERVMKKAYGIYKPLHPRQLEFIRRLERGDLTAEEVLEELKVTGTVFGQWLQKPTFVKRYQRALEQMRARAASLEAAAGLRQARKRLREESEKAEGNSVASGPAVEESVMGKRLVELHGAGDVVEEKARGMEGK
jgi:hypothetical protein